MGLASFLKFGKSIDSTRFDSAGTELRSAKKRIVWSSGHSIIKSRSGFFAYRIRLSECSYEFCPTPDFDTANRLATTA
jgi:hypothetical protein